MRLTIRALDAMADIDAAIDEHGSVKQVRARAPAPRPARPLEPRAPRTRG